LNLKPWKACLLCLALAAAAALPAAAPKFDAPTGLTLQAQGGGRYLLLWDPIYRDDLQGYSVWLRKPGDKEFVRLSIPVKVGKEIKKEPMTSDSKLVLSMGRDRDDLEMTVVAEYEDGVSPKAPVVLSAGAVRPAAAPAPGAEAAAGAEGASPTAAAAGTSATAQLGPYPLDADKAPPDVAGQPKPWEKREERALRPLLVAPGKIRTELGADFTYFRSIYNGNDLFGSLGLIGTGIDPNKEVYWQRIDVRTIFSVPLTVRLGLLPGIEGYAQAAYHAEDYFIGLFRIDGQDFSYIQFVHWNDTTMQYDVLSNPSSTGIGDIPIGLRIQPIESQPLVLTAQLTLPTGQSRFKAYLDWFSGRGTPAGTGEGITRLKVALDYGWKGLRSGVAFNAGFSPGGTEQYNEDDGSGGPVVHQVVTHGDIYQLGGDWTWPWQLEGQSGSMALGIEGRSITAAKWTSDGVDQVQFLDPTDRSAIAALTQLKFERDDQLEFSLEAFQDLPGGFETSGKLSYAMESFGDQWAISGQFYY
jgi:hypothetical protein